jgi:hypothetical protein
MARHAYEFNDRNPPTPTRCAPCPSSMQHSPGFAIFRRRQRAALSQLNRCCRIDDRLPSRFVTTSASVDAAGLARDRPQ